MSIPHYKPLASQDITPTIPIYYFRCFLLVDYLQILELTAEVAKYLEVADNSPMDYARAQELL